MIELLLSVVLAVVAASAFFWNNEINIEILPYSQYHLDAIVSSDLMEPWRLTCVYGEAQVRERRNVEIHQILLGPPVVMYW
jgi:hypothetical protein